MMNTNILSTYFNISNNRFFFIFGETSDEFCESNLNFANLHKILHKHLKKLEYERIVFYEGTKGFHCHDQKSFDLAFNPKKVSEKDTFSKLALFNTNFPVTSYIIKDVISLFKVL